MKYIVAFDIASTKKRNRVAKECLAYGFRVQKSVFEIFLESERLPQFNETMLKLINPDSDSVRIYPLDKDNDENIQIIGTGKFIKQDCFAII